MMQRLSFEPSTVKNQDKCPLFNSIPAEVRTLILAFALAPFEDPDPVAEFEENTSFKRPNYSVPCKIDAAVLRTCRRIYLEAWFLPLTLSQQIFY